jgi:hypothetical protein
MAGSTGGWNIDKDMKEFILGDRCMRVVADREMDGRVDRLGCKIGERRCRVCRGRG